MSAGVHISKVTARNHGLKIFGKNIAVSISDNIGLGFEFSYGLKTEIGLTIVKGWTITIEVYEE